MKKICRIGLALVAVVTLFGCKGQVENKENNFEFSAPYATLSELEEIERQSSDYVNYKMLRTLAMLEMQEFNEQHYWSSNAVLSETPVIIWQNDTTPKYYEFHVIDGGSDVGYVTCNVNKKNGDPVAYVGMEKQDYSNDVSRSIAAGTHKVFAANYPAFKVSDTSRNLESYELIDKDEAFYDIIDSMSEEDFSMEGTTKEEVIAEYEEEKESENIRLEKLWSMIYDAEENLINLSDDEIIALFDEETESERSSLTSYTSSSSNLSSNFAFLLPYSTTRGNRNFEGCVPSVIEFVAQCYRNDKKLAKSDNDIKNAIQTKIGNGNIKFLSSGWADALKSATDNKLTVTSSLLSHKFDKIDKNIKDNLLPVFSCRLNGKTIFSAFDIGHCRCITGTCTLNKKIEKKILWIKWTKWEKTGYYYMWDNTVDLTHNASSEPAGTASSYKNGSYNHFWEKDGSWFYWGTKTVVNN